jgi:uncharacterized membrane protein
MGKSRLLHILVGLIMVFTLLVGFVAAPLAVLAADATATPAETTTPAPQPSLTMDCKYPVIKNDSGMSFNFSVDIHYSGQAKKIFDISATAPQNAPQNWSVTTTAGYPESQVSAIEITPSDFSSTETIKVNLAPNMGYYPEPGDYVITVKVSSDTLSQSIDLKATVKARYQILLTTDSGNLNTKATAGKDNHFSFKLMNTGTANVDNINFRSTPPEGWVVTFNPTSIVSSGPNQIQQVDAVIKPPEGKTIAGDYMVTISASNGSISSSDMSVRVTVVTPSIWGWVGIIIVVLVIAALGVLFMRLGRR